MINIWFWNHLALVITVCIVLAVVGYAFLFAIFIRDMKEWREFKNAINSDVHNQEH